jgi:two-component system chemotaxis sensor kinase CheA
MSDDEILREFLVESHEGLDQLDREFVELEREPNARGRIATIFRTIHTIKGTSGFLGFSKLEALTHAGETLLSRLRDGELTLTSDITTTLLTLVDVVRGMLRVIEASGSDGEGKNQELIERLSLLASGKVLVAPPAPPPPQAAPAPAQVRPPVEATTSARPPSIARVSAPAAPVSMAPASGSAKVPSRAPATTSRPAAVMAAAIAKKGTTSEAPKNAGRLTGEFLLERKSVSPPAEIVPALDLHHDERAAKAVDGTVRVGVELLDQLMDLVGELVLARNQILQFSASVKDPTFLGPTQRLNVLTTELQEGVMKTRMQQIGNVWNKLPRVVRDVSMACGKQVKLRTTGGATDLDRTVIEAIKDPLTHIVRNAIDHGIEAPETRIARGKPATGTLSLRAYHEGGQVNIEISDDGAGMDPKRIREIAVRKGLVLPDRAARMTDRESIELVFLPGFSTADSVTNVSGRGVGMDVVRTNIEKIGGHVDIQSTVGVGTTLKIKIPLTLAIIPALIVACREGRYAIPQVNLLELVRLEGDAARSAIEMVQGAPVFRLRGSLLPLADLADTLALPPRAAAGDADPVLSIIVLQADERRFGLVVDGVSDTQEIVVKPLGLELKGIPVFAGATIMGDGKVALILDVLGLAHRAEVMVEHRRRAADDESAKTARVERAESVLVAHTRAGRRLAVPLSVVARLEEIPHSALERAGDLDVAQYRGDILPLIDAGSLFGEEKVAARADDDRPLQVIVYAESGRSVGIVVDRIVDIVDEVLTIKHSSTRRGIRGAAILQNRVTEVLDVADIVRAFISGERAA